MRTRTFFALALALVIALAASVAHAQDAAQPQAPAPMQEPADSLAAPSLPGPYMQEEAIGAVDWNSGMITATGIGAPPAGAVNAAQARGMAMRAATVIARRNLLELIKGVQIDSTTTVQNFMVSSDVVVSRIRGFLQNSQLVDKAYMSDGSVEVTVGVYLRGGLSDIILPSPTQFKPTRIGSVPGPAPVASLAPSEPVAAPARAYTGLLIDARGLSVRPAMSPRILDEEGVEVYGTSMVAREYAIQQGMAGYAKNPDKALTNPRVGEHPYQAKAVGTQGPSQADLVISNEQAQAIRDMAESKDFLAQTRVMIVLD